MLIEAIVSISLVLGGLMGIISLLIKASHTNRELGQSLKATYLAAEGIEVVKNVIDTDVAGGGVWNKTVKPGIYSVDYGTAGDLNDSNRDVFLEIDDKGRYGYGIGAPTLFKRFVQVDVGSYLCNQDTFRVKSVVSINGASCDDDAATEGCVRIQDEFYDWRSNIKCGM